jgi:hypothetical protein
VLRIISIVALVIGYPSLIAAAPADYVIHISIDGLAGDIIDDAMTLYPDFFPNFVRLRDGGAYTPNARTDFDDTYTIPNHTSMITGRPVLQPEGQPSTVHHGVLDDSPSAPQTIHNSGNPSVPYFASTFDVVHNRGWTTALYASKLKFDFYDRSYDASHGAPDSDPTGGNNGTDKINQYVYNSNTQALASNFVTAMETAPYRYSFVHFLDPDAAGHQYGWESGEYLDSVVNVDTGLGMILDLATTNTRLRNKTAIILTADHGGTGFGHGDETNFFVYNIPLFVWGPGFAAGDLYGYFPQTRADPGPDRPDYNADPQPLRNGDSGNIALHLLGLGSVPGSTINPYVSQAPIAEANGPYEFRGTALSVTASAAGSRDPDGGTLAYSWTKGTSPTAASNVVTLAQSGLTSPSSTSAIMLTVTDSSSQTGSDTAELRYVNTPPTVDAGPDIVFDGTMATVAVTGTVTDPDVAANSQVAGFETLTLAWSAGQTPASAANSISFAQAVAAGLTTGAPATLALTATDRSGTTGADSLAMRYRNTEPRVVGVFGGLDGAGSLLFGAEVSEPDLAVNDAGFGDFEQLDWEFDFAPATTPVEIGDGFLTGTMTATEDGRVRGAVDIATLASEPGFVCCFVDAYINVVDLSGAVHSAAAPAYLTAGDVDFDGRVNGRDMAKLVSQFGVRTAATLASGDLTGDGRVGLRDFLQLRDNWSGGASPAILAAVAEPNTFCVALLIVAAAFANTRFRRASHKN